MLCSQVQAFLDLGCDVEFVYLQTRDGFFTTTCDYFKQLTYTVLDARTEKTSKYTRLAYLAGWPEDASWRQLYPARELLQREVQKRIDNDRTAIHLFNYLRTANVIPSLPNVRTIWACHEIESEFHAMNSAISQELEGRKPNAWEKRTLRRLTGLERKVAKAAGLVLCVSAAEAKQIVEQWSMPHAAYLPFSIGNGDMPIIARECRSQGELRLLHVGGLDHAPTYTSLEFLFTKVFPLLDEDTISKLKLEVAGRMDPDGKWSKAIVEMARPYPMVRFSGFVDDIRTAYQRNDLQVVASTQATGIRTRVVESWAFGLPVVSTTLGAGGVEGLELGQNILIADDPRDFARILQELIHGPMRLDKISAAARQTYEDQYSRRAVAGVLCELLNSKFDLQLSPVASLTTVN